MKIVLLADHKKNELLVNFCVAYGQILIRHKLLSLFHTAHLLEQTTQLKVEGLPTDMLGGLDQLAARAMFNEIDAVIYLRDPQSNRYDEHNPLMQACDVNLIPFASNLAAAEILILAVDRGDLDWRHLLQSTMK